MTKGNVRGSSDDFADVFHCTATEASKCLKTLEREGVILKASPLPGARAVYSYNQRNAESESALHRPTANYKRTAKGVAAL